MNRRRSDPVQRKTPPQALEAAHRAVLLVGQSSEMSRRLSRLLREIDRDIAIRRTQLDRALEAALRESLVLVVSDDMDAGSVSLVGDIRRLTSNFHTQAIMVTENCTPRQNARAVRYGLTYTLANNAPLREWRALLSNLLRTPGADAAAARGRASSFQTLECREKEALRAA